jgi:hypothetical protein
MPVRPGTDPETARQTATELLRGLCDENLVLLRGVPG